MCRASLINVVTALYLYFLTIYVAAPIPITTPMLFS